MKLKRLPAGFVIPAQPVMASEPPSGADWVHEIKHDGYRLIVRRDGAAVRLYSREAFELTARLPVIAAAAERIRAWINVRNPASVAVQRERSEIWNR
jgi:ATP-dependent DNA ligase